LIPFAALRIASYRGGTAMTAHAHDHDVLCLPLAGAYVERTRGRETRHSLGDVLFCPAGESHSQRFPEEDVAKLLIVAAGEARDYLGAYLPLAEAPFVRSRALPAIALRLAREVRSPDRQSPLIAEGLCLELLGLFARAPQRRETAARWLRTARTFVLENAAAKLSLRDVAAHVGRAPIALSAAYRAHFGCTIGEDARSARLETAARLLAAASEPIAGIAADCGYFDQAHFTRAFKAAYGVTPGAYRAALH
jgi:AraC family transcriptional regulator